jgi:hypothetical protein
MPRDSTILMGIHHELRDPGVDSFPWTIFPTVFRDFTASTSIFSKRQPAMTFLFDDDDFLCRSIVLMSLVASDGVTR